MPDEFVFGKMRVTRQPVPDTNTAPADRTQIWKLVAIDCKPPGAIDESVKPTDISPAVLPPTLQAGESLTLGELAQAADPAISGGRAAVAAILAQAGARVHPIHYDIETYRDLLVPDDCHRLVVYLRVEYEVIEIKVAANEAVTVRGVSYPKDDEIATFRAATPKRHRFETLYERNPLCCPEEEEPPEGTVTDWFERKDWSQYLDWHYKPQLKRDWEFRYPYR